MRKYTIISLLLIIFLIINMVYGQATRIINYQGLLTDNSVPITGSRQMTFKIYDSMTGGTVLWQETYPNVAIFNGLFNVSLGSVTPISLSFDGPYWLAIQVAAGAELTPRISLGNVGNSFYSFKADSAFNIPDNMITTAKIVNGAITQAKLDPGLSLPPGGTAGGDLTGTYPNPSIAGDAVVSSKIANGTIIGDDLANNAVTTPKIANGAVTQAKLDPGLSLPPGGTAGGDLTGTYPNPAIASNAVTSSKILDGTIAAADIGTNAVGISEIAANSVGTSELQSSVDFTPAGSVEIGNASGALRALFTFNGAGGGYSSIDTDDGGETVRMTQAGTGAAASGYFNVNANDGSQAIILRTVTVGTEQVGDIQVNNGSGVLRSRLTLNSGNGGALFTNAIDGSNAVWITTTGAGASQGGWIDVRNAAGAATISLNGTNGAIVGTIKSFRIDHPSDPSKEIYYVSLEGPEAGVYTRGTAQLINGSATIQLPEHFALVAADQGITVSLTPLSTDSEGLAVVSKSRSEIVVQEFKNGSGNYEFDYIVHAVRSGYENFQVVRDKAASPEMAPAAPAVIESAPAQNTQQAQD